MSRKDQNNFFTDKMFYCAPTWSIPIPMWNAKFWKNWEMTIMHHVGSTSLRIPVSCYIYAWGGGAPHRRRRWLWYQVLGSVVASGCAIMSFVVVIASGKRPCTTWCCWKGRSGVDKRRRERWVKILMDDTSVCTRCARACIIFGTVKCHMMIFYIVAFFLPF